MKRRNLILAFVIIGLFLAAGRLYFRVYVRQKPFAVVLFVTEGLTSSRLAAARQYAAGADGRLTLDYLPRVALLRGGAADYAAADGASAASAISIGARVNLRAVGIEPGGRTPRTLVDFARAQGRVTGIVTNSPLTDGPSAAFYARSPDVRHTEDIARQLVDEGKFEVMFGMGAGDFRGVMKGGKRQDSRDLDRELVTNGYSLARSLPELDGIPAWKLPRVAALLADEEAAPDVELSELVRRAIEYLEKRPGGYFLVVHAGLSERAARGNDAEGALRQMLELDRAVATAWRFAGDKTLLLVAGLNETGGLTMNGYPLRSDRGVALLGVNPTSNLPTLTWATGPNGRGTPDAAGRNDPAATYSTDGIGTVADSLLFGSGEAAETLPGTLENTALFEFIKKEL